MAKKTTRKSRVQAADTTGEIEVEEVTTVEETPAKPPAGIETWLIAVTWTALVAALLLINFKLHQIGAKGWPI